MARVIKICKIFRNLVARVISKRWLALSRGMARVIKICKIFRNLVACVRSKHWLAEWLAEWLALSKYLKSLEIRWLALQVSVGSRWLAEWLALSKYVKIVSIAVARVISKRWLAKWLALSTYEISFVMRWFASYVKSLGSRFYNSL